MNPKSVSHFSIYQNLRRTPKQRDEARQAMYFFSSLQNYLEVRDVVFGEDPPDFIVETANKRIAVELTRSNPTPSAGGFSRIKAFKDWEKELEQKQITDQATFLWGKYSSRETLDEFKSHLERKARAAGEYRNRYNETWLILDADEGSSIAIFICGIWKANDEKSEDYRGKFFYEMNNICLAAEQFDRVLFFHGPNLLTFPVGENQYGFPTPSADLIERGAKASETFLAGLPLFEPLIDASR